MSETTISQLWEDEYFLHWEAVEERGREPIEETKAKYEAADGIEEARAWLTDNDIDPDKLPFQCKLVHVTGSNDFEIPLPDACGRIVWTFNEQPQRHALIFPVIIDGQFLDLMILDIEDFSFFTVRHKAIWLGSDNISGAEVRLHKHPMDWLGAGSTGCCYIDPQRRTPMKRLQAVGKIYCNDVELALEAWEWGFSAHDEHLDRFEIDDHPDNIRDYFEAQAMAQALSRKHQGRFNLVMA
ncbi:hypothetical protein [Sinorhizobium meliloti]|uniref:hypothetical protein n=1 Tax=Rhizobium meliloti TaxID=382 RepID=UPI0012961FEF|nr:hypothetical protein [Sinorhizobium meliloti]MQX70072.1 hypothetical protein [Sinorhizobium meliloti]